MQGSVSAIYEARVAGGHFNADPAQQDAARQLDRLALTLQAPRRRAGLGWLNGRTSEPPRGLYIWGAVGRGKTMLMDLFFEIAPVALKRRVHFHAFMADVHARIHLWREARRRGETKGDDPIAPVASQLALEAKLLCFDEFSVTDIADAMILSRLFQALFGHGVVVVATSNVEPAMLYQDGLNRALFLPFLHLLAQRVAVLHLVAARDFRLEKLLGAPVYQVPADARAQNALDEMFVSLSGGQPTLGLDLPVLGRLLHVPRAAGPVARFSFAQLCEAALGAADYLSLARHFHTIFIDAIPVIGPEQRDVAKRFIILIDTLYDAHVKLIASAAASPADLYRASEGREAFEFQRTISRLTEMGSQDYLALPHGQTHSRGSGDTSGLVET